MRSAVERKAVKLPSVTMILSCTRTDDSSERLLAWQRRKIAELGRDGFDEAMEKMRRIGHVFHSAVASRLLKRDECFDSYHQSEDDSGVNVSGYLASVEPLLSSGQLSATHVEHMVTHHRLCYIGVLDAVCTYKDRLTLFDWKTSTTAGSKGKMMEDTGLKSLYDDPVQLAAYVGAFNSDGNCVKNARSRKNRIRSAAVVLAHECGKEATVVELSQREIEQCWQQWIDRLHQFWTTMGELEDGEVADFVCKITE